MSNTILLVDRFRTSRGFSLSLLRGRKDWQVLAASDGLEALEILGSRAVDLVILDLDRVELDGLELIQEMARWFPRTPVILLTSSEDETSMIQAIRAGAATFVPKSFQAEQLGPAIERILSLSLTGQELNAARLDEFETLITVRSDQEVASEFIDRLNDLLVQADFGGLGPRICFCEFLQELACYLLAQGERQILDRTSQELLDRPQNRRAARSNNYYGRSRRVPRTAELFITIHLSPDQLSLTLCPKGQGFDLPSLPVKQSAESADLGKSPWLGLTDLMLDDFGFDRSGRVLCLLKRRVEFPKFCGRWFRVDWNRESFPCSGG